mgnify:CR=1 FL=1
MPRMNRRQRKQLKKRKPLTERRKNFFAVELSKEGFADVFPVMREGKLLEKGTRRINPKQISEMKPAVWAPEHLEKKRIVYIETDRNKKTRRLKPSMPGIRRLRRKWIKSQKQPKNSN